MYKRQEVFDVNIAGYVDYVKPLTVKTKLKRFKLTVTGRQNQEKDYYSFAESILSNSPCIEEIEFERLYSQSNCLFETGLQQHGFKNLRSVILNPGSVWSQTYLISLESLSKLLESDIVSKVIRILYLVQPTHSLMQEYKKMVDFIRQNDLDVELLLE